ncbi:MAG TPA: hypothetical protein VFB38_14955 [Chthonomonadaceae bacterium]|nr:hypothetical protein [Chthonomonadaceae bacterium]
MFRFLRSTNANQIPEVISEANLQREAERLLKAYRAEIGMHGM